MRTKKENAFVGCSTNAFKLFGNIKAHFLLSLHRSENKGICEEIEFSILLMIEKSLKILE